MENTKFYEKGEDYSYCIRKKRMCIKYSKNYRNLCKFFAQIPVKMSAHAEYEHSVKKL